MRLYHDPLKPTSAASRVSWGTYGEAEHLFRKDGIAWGVYEH